MMTLTEKGAHFYSLIVGAMDEADRQQPFELTVAYAKPGLWRVQGSSIRCSEDVADALIEWERRSGIRGIAA